MFGLVSLCSLNRKTLFSSSLFVNLSMLACYYLLLFLAEALSFVRSILGFYIQRHREQNYLSAANFWWISFSFVASFCINFLSVIWTMKMERNEAGKQAEEKNQLMFFWECWGILHRYHSIEFLKIRLYSQFHCAKEELNVLLYFSKEYTSSHL